MFLERDEMKFAILYTLKRYNAPINMPILSDILIWGKEVMGYFDLAVIIDELTEDEYIETTHYRGDICYQLSEKGTYTNEFFFERVPKSIRRRIDEAVSNVKFDEQVDPHAINAEILPVAAQQYMASLQMLDSGSPMLELKVFAGSKAEAEQAAKQMKAKASKIYEMIISEIKTEER